MILHLIRGCRIGVGSRKLNTSHGDIEALLEITAWGPADIQISVLVGSHDNR